MSLHKVLSVTALTEATSLIRFSREGLDFRAGQFLLLGLPGGDLREYSIFSRPQDDWLEILVRVIPDGAVSSQLVRLSRGDAIQVQGVQGAFVVDEATKNKPLLFVATGTGIAPYHSIVGAHADISYQLYHGVRFAHECYVKEAFDPDRYHPCLSREQDEKGRAYNGRVTQLLANTAIGNETECYLCGSCDMIYEMFALLQQKGIPRAQIHTETYY